MPPRLLIIPAMYRSHVIPAIDLAELLKNQFDVYILSINETLDEIIIQNGYKPVGGKNLSYQLGTELAFIKEIKQENPSYWKYINTILKNEVFDFRKTQLKYIIVEKNISTVIIDIFNSVDYLILRSLDIPLKLMFFNPMPSTYKVEGFPIVSENVWPVNDVKQVAKKQSPKVLFKNPKQILIIWAKKRQLAWQLKTANLTSEALAKNITMATLFGQEPELMLLPLSFEFSSKVKQPNQYYLGLCQRQKRIDTEIDRVFENHWANILERKQANSLLVYCSFGTYYQGPDKLLLDFYERIISTVLELPNTILVCSVNKFVLEFLTSKNLINDNIFVFTNVPQTRVLAQSNVFITHGGMGSIKESIYHQVPMLVYPLDTKIDQNGNGFKIEHHGLGLRGTFGFEQKGLIKEKIVQLINNQEFKQKLKEFNADLEKEYAPEILTKTFKTLFA